MDYKNFVDKILDIRRSTKDMMSRCTSQDGLPKSESLLSLKEIKFCK